MRRAFVALVVAAWVATPAHAGAAPAARGDSVRATVGPSVALVAPPVRIAVGDTLDVTLRVSEAGIGFNGYDAVVAFDPAALAPLDVTPQRDLEGAYMLGACGNTFHRIRMAGDSVVVAHVVLCPDASLSGPGTLHLFRFRALAAGRTRVRLARTQFYDAGRYLPPARMRDTVLVIGTRPAARSAARGTDGTKRRTP